MDAQPLVVTYEYGPLLRWSSTAGALTGPIWCAHDQAPVYVYVQVRRQWSHEFIDGGWCPFEDFVLADRLVHRAPCGVFGFRRSFMRLCTGCAARSGRHLHADCFPTLVRQTWEMMLKRHLNAYLGALTQDGIALGLVVAKTGASREDIPMAPSPRSPSHTKGA